MVMDVLQRIPAKIISVSDVVGSTQWAGTWYTGKSEFAIDGDPNTKWTYRGLGGITFDLGELKIISSLNISFNGSVSNGNYAEIYVDGDKITEGIQRFSTTWSLGGKIGRFIEYRTVPKEHYSGQIATWSEVAEAKVEVSGSYGNIIKSVPMRKSRPLKGKLKGTEKADLFAFSEFDKFKLGRDKIINFNPSDGDKIGVSSSAFPSLSDVGEINFASTGSKKELKLLSKEGYNFIYHENSGRLFYNGRPGHKGWGDHEEGGLVAILKGKPELTSDDIMILA